METTSMYVHTLCFYSAGGESVCQLNILPHKYCCTPILLYPSSQAELSPTLSNSFTRQVSVDTLNRWMWGPFWFHCQQFPIGKFLKPKSGRRRRLVLHTNFDSDYPVHFIIKLYLLPADSESDNCSVQFILPLNIIQILRPMNLIGL